MYISSRESHGCHTSSTYKLKLFQYMDRNINQVNHYLITSRVSPSHRLFAVFQSLLTKPCNAQRPWSCHGRLRARRGRELWLLIAGWDTVRWWSGPNRGMWVMPPGGLWCVGGWGGGGSARCLELGEIVRRVRDKISGTFMKDCDGELLKEVGQSGWYLKGHLRCTWTLSVVWVFRNACRLASTNTVYSCTGPKACIYTEQQWDSM